MRFSKSQIAALQKLRIKRVKRKLKLTPPPPPAPYPNVIPNGYTQAIISTCCGAPVRKRSHSSKRVHICTTCNYVCSTITKIIEANLIPAYGRRPHTKDLVLDLLYRGLDFQTSPSAKYVSIRDMAAFADLQIRYGKRLQHVLCIKLQPTKS